MAKLEDLSPRTVVEGARSDAPVTVVSVQRFGESAIDGFMSLERYRQLIEENALARDTMDTPKLQAIREDMELGNGTDGSTAGRPVNG